MPVAVTTTATAPSSTRHAEGRANVPDSHRAPNPSALNHSTLPVIAPAANHHRSPPNPVDAVPSSSTVSSYTCGLSQVRARQVTIAADAAPASAAPPHSNADGRSARRAASTP